MYQAMTGLGFAAESPYRGPIKLEGDPKGASVLVLGAGLAGLVAAFELSKAGYKVEVLEYNGRAGGRCWTIRGGDRYTELGGFEQECRFEKGLYLNPGPWRLPYHHYAILDYCKRLGVSLEPFIQVNYNAYLHAKNAFAGKPQRFRHVLSDFHGHIAELLAKAANQDKLDRAVSADDKEMLLEALREWGALDSNYTYAANFRSSERRGYSRAPGGGLSAGPEPSQPIGLDEILRSRLWQRLAMGSRYTFQSTLFQPAGGMDMTARAFAKEVGHLIRYNAKVTEIRQDGNRVTVSYTHAVKGGKPITASAGWCLCTIPLSVLSQIEMDVGSPMRAAIDAVSYEASVKTGLQFNRRFWEQDEGIYGGITYTDLPIRQIAYPSAGYGSAGKGVLLAAYAFGPYALEFTALPPQERIKLAIACGAQIHPQYEAEYENGMSVGWHRVPWALGCFGSWAEDARRQHYETLCAFDGRIALAGEHASFLPAWQEGAILSALDAIARLHRRVVGH
jgi:monoamine oxidase